jgi:hypothetical protein
MLKNFVSNKVSGSQIQNCSKLNLLKTLLFSVIAAWECTIDLHIINRQGVLTYLHLSKACDPWGAHLY